VREVCVETFIQGFHQIRFLLFDIFLIGISYEIYIFSFFVFFIFHWVKGIFFVELVKPSAVIFGSEFGGIRGPLVSDLGPVHA
jgi:hypothetical protein